MKNPLAAMRAKIVAATQRSFIWLFSLALERRGKFYTKIIILCNVLCFLEIWRKITNDKPVDERLPLYDQINDAIDFYLSLSSNSRGEIPIFERDILRYNYVKWVLRNRQKEKENQAHDFVRENDLAATMEKYTNLRNYINYRATEELTPFELAVKHSPSAEYWKFRFLREKLPAPLQTRPRPRFIRSYLQKQIIKSKRAIASSNYLKIKFSLSDVTALIEISAAILLVLGYSRVAIINWWFGIPYQNYYSISDYIASSVNSIAQYLIAAAAAAVLWGLYLATINAHSLQTAGVEARRLGGRINSWLLHIVGITGACALIVVFIVQHRIDALSLEAIVLYLGMPAIGYVSANFFSTPYRAFLFLSLFFTAFVSGLGGVFLEIERVAALSSGLPVRLIKFVDKEYVEPDWAVIGITSDFVILRRRRDGSIQVRLKRELRSIENLQPDQAQDPEDHAAPAVKGLPDAERGGSGVRVPP